MAKYLDENGLLYFWQKIKNLFAQKTDLPGVVSKTAAGLAPKLPNETATTKFLRQDGSWEVPTGTTYDPATADPLMDGTAAVGTSAKYAREDHVHPSDTTKVDKETGKGLSTNDYTTAEKNKLSGIAAGAQVNVVEAVKVNGTAQTVTSKAVDITVPTKTSDLTNDSNFAVDASYVHTDNNYTTTEKNKLAAFGAASDYALKTDISAMYKYKGSVATASALPSTGQSVGDVYNIEAASSYGGAGMNVAWNGTAWDPLGEIFTITAVSNSDIDTIVAS